MKRRIGYLPENPYFYDYLTAEELLDVLRRPVRLPGRRTGATRVARLLDEVGLGAERRLQLRKFSKGMIQRVGLAQALINDPEVVFLDEPMSGLDPLGRRDVRALILRLRDEGRTVFFSSHILSDAETLCSRIAIVAKGRLMAVGHARRSRRRRSSRAGRSSLDGLPQAPPRVACRASAPCTTHRARALRGRRAARRGPAALSRASSPARRAPRLDQPSCTTRSRICSCVRSIRRPGTDRFAGRRRPRRREARDERRVSVPTVLRIAANVFKESVRDKVLYSIVLLRGPASSPRRCCSASSRPGRRSRSSRTSAWRRSRCSATSSPSSSASAWSRRKSSGAASTRCWPSR